MAYVLKEHRFAIHIFMFQRGKAQFYLRMAFSEGQWPLRYFHCLLLSRFFCLRKGISDLLMRLAWKFSTCCHSHCGNPFCWKGHSSPMDLYNSRKYGTAAGIAQERKTSRNMGEESGRRRGESVWRKGKALCPNPFASQHTESNDDVVWDAGGGGQGSVCSRPCMGGLRAERISLLSGYSSSVSPSEKALVESVALRRREGGSPGATALSYPPASNTGWPLASARM